MNRKVIEKQPRKFQENKCYFCAEPIYSYVEVRGFYIGKGCGIDEVIPICHICWIKEWYSGKIDEEWGAGKSYYGKDDLEGDWWDEEEIYRLSEYYHQQNPKGKRINVFIRYCSAIKFSNELKTTIELLEREKEWSDCYDWIRQLRFEITPSDGHKQHGEIFRYNQLKKNPRLKELYEKLEKVDIEELWKKEVQREVIPIYKEIVKIRTESRKNNVCSLCFLNPLVMKVDIVFAMDHLAQEHKNEKTDYLCKNCVKMK